MKRRRSGGFALPTVIIASVIMMVVLLSAVSSTAAIRVSIKEQYYNQLSRSGADAGLAYAKACLAKSGGIATWSNVNPLKPNTDCSGVQLSGFDCSTTPTDVRCTMTRNGNITSTFSVGTPTSYILGWATNDNLNAKTISSGNLFTCGLTFNKTPFCWGDNTYGQLGNGVSGSYASMLSPSAVSTIGRASTIASGYNHACAIKFDGKAYCWGDQTSGAVGNGTTSGISTTPVAVTTTNLANADKNFKLITAGGHHSCGVSTTNIVYCWGRNTEGQLGNASNTDSAIPVPVDVAGALAGRSILAISAGENFTCAIASASTSAGGTTNQAFCWGYNAYGQLGNANTGTNQNVPVAVSIATVLASKSVASIATGQNHACAIAAGNAVDSAVYCWGNNASGQLGTNSTVLSNIPVAIVDSNAVLGAMSATNISAGGSSTCMTASDAKVYCWGLNTNGQLGDASNTQRNAAVAVSTADKLSGKTLQALSVGPSHTCALAADDQLYCWGGTLAGAIGNGDTKSYNVPVSVLTSSMTGAQAVSVTSKGSANLIRTSDSSVWQSYSSISKFDYSDRAWKQVSTALKHVCAVSNDGKAYCWGDNTYGQLGNNTSTDQSSPTAVYTGTSSSPGVLYGKTIINIQSSERFTCALGSDYNVYCWGDNTDGELGNGSGATYSAVPVAVTKANYASKAVKQLSVGRFHTCVVTSMNLVYCWGKNNTGQLGNNTSVDSNVPVAVNTATLLSGLSILSVSAGGQFSCALASNSNVYCWGLANTYQLGDNTTTTSSLYTSCSLYRWSAFRKEGRFDLRWF